MVKYEYNEPLFNVVVTSNEDILTGSSEVVPGGNQSAGDLVSGEIPLG